MLRSLNSRLLFSYTIVVLVCLALVGLGLLLFLRSSPLWTRAAAPRLEEATQMMMAALQRAGSLENLPPARLHALLARAAEEHEVRGLLINAKGIVLFDSHGEWEGERLTGAGLTRPVRGRVRGTLTAPDGGRWLFLGETLPSAGERQTLLFASPPARLLLLAWFVENLVPPLLRAGLVALVLSILLALLISRSVSKPLRRVATAAEAIAQGETDARAPISGPSEIRAVARSFNAMADRVQTAQQSQQDFVANISHELKTPLTSIQGFSQALLDGTASAPEATARAARVIHDEAERVRRMVDELLILARFDAGQMVLARDPVEISPLLQSCVEKLTPQAEAAEVTLEVDVSHRLFVTGDADRLGQVITNLLDNGIAHSPPGGKVTLAAFQADGGRAVAITVTDSGEGIPAAALNRIFERFHQLDRSRKHSRGAGLGLAITKEIVEAHGGRIGAESVTRLGSKFTVWLPAREGDTASTVTKRRREPGPAS